MAKPDQPWICFQLAQVQAQLGMAESAIESIRCAMSGGFTNRAAYEADPLLAPLAQVPAFVALMESLSPPEGDE